MTAAEDAQPTFHANVYRDNRWYLIEVTGGTFAADEAFWTQASDEADIERMARDLIATLEDRAADSFDLTVTRTESQPPF